MDCASGTGVQSGLGTSGDFFAPAEVRIVDPLEEPNWDRLVLSHPGFNFFHRTAWAKVLYRTYGHKPFYLHFYRADESLALVPIMEVVSPITGRRGISMPFSDFCQPLVFGEWGREALMAKLLELGRARSWRYFELRGGRESLPGSAVPAEKYYGHKLDLTIGLDQLFDRFQSSVRRAVRKAQKNALVAHADKSWEAMMDFYKLHVRTRRRHGLPPQPLSFFRNIHEEVVQGGLGFVILAKRHLRPFAAAVFFYSGEEALYKFGASDDRHQEVRGNNLVMWEAIKRLAEKGFATMHFGRTAVEDEGLRRFKLSWGTQEDIIEYFKFALNGQRWLNSCRDASEFHKQLFRRLPLAANRLAGALIYPHLD